VQTSRVVDPVRSDKDTGGLERHSIEVDPLRSLKSVESAQTAQPNGGQALDQANGAEIERRLAAIAQDLAAFGGESSSRIELRHWHADGALNLFAA
jgi:hypothetical protein